MRYLHGQAPNVRGLAGQAKLGNCGAGKQEPHPSRGQAIDLQACAAEAAFDLLEAAPSWSDVTAPNNCMGPRFGEGLGCHWLGCWGLDLSCLRDIMLTSSTGLCSPTTFCCKLAVSVMLLAKPFTCIAKMLQQEVAIQAEYAFAQRHPC